VLELGSEKAMVKATEMETVTVTAMVTVTVTVKESASVKELEYLAGRLQRIRPAG
jgi:hypothetical protein